MLAGDLSWNNPNWDSLVGELTPTTKTGGIEGIEGFIGGNRPTVTDLLIGPNSNADWTIDGVNAGMLSSAATGSVSIIGFESLTGGNQADRFAFTDSGRITRNLAGGQRSVDLNSEWHPTVLSGMKCYTCDIRPFPSQGQVGHSERPEIPGRIRLPISPPGKLWVRLEEDQPMDLLGGYLTPNLQWFFLR